MGDYGLRTWITKHDGYVDGTVAQNKYDYQFREQNPLTALLRRQDGGVDVLAFGRYGLDDTVLPEGNVISRKNASLRLHVKRWRELRSLRFVSTWSRYGCQGLLRGNGSVAYVGKCRPATFGGAWEHNQPPALPKGLIYSGLEDGVETGLVAARSDGMMVLVDSDWFSKAVRKEAIRWGEEWKKLEVPRLERGWRYVDAKEITSKFANPRWAFLAERIPQGEIVAAGITAPATSKPVARGKRVTIQARVVTQGIVKEGLVRATYKGAQVGTATLKANGKTTITITTKNMKKPGSHKVKLQFLGSVQATKSGKATVAVQITRSR